MWGREGDVLRGHVADEELGTPAPPPARSGVDLGYRADAVGVAGDGTDSGDRAVYVVDPDLALLNEFTGLDARTVEGEREEDLRTGVMRSALSSRAKTNSLRTLTLSSANSLQSCATDSRSAGVARRRRWPVGGIALAPRNVLASQKEK